VFLLQIGAAKDHMANAWAPFSSFFVHRELNV